MPPSPAVPGLVPVAHVHVLLDPPLEVGRTPFGREREIPIVGGRVSGPGRDGEGLHGAVLRGGADRQRVLDDGTAVIDTRYSVALDSGHLLQLATSGYRTGPPAVLDALLAGDAVDPAAYYFRVVVDARTADPDRAWLNTAVLVASAVRTPGAVAYDAYLLT
ncbi:DUF3237 domain-containing protein [Pseudonocardia spirodelae]|uniref:DUF3237 domain-containing protein n=1 Tax=Pseudonocardia spirodelae TaxID=3133431 RepID=A0ABU8T921_9PSEU